MSEKLHIIPHQHAIQRQDRETLNQHASCVLWFCGLSGSGKSTIANVVEQKLFHKNVRTYILDGDNVRKGLNANLDFTEEARKENLRRVIEVSKLMMDAGLVVLTAFISPFESERKKAKDIIGESKIVEIFIDTPIEICEQRDVKGLYKKARKGEISNFTGINSPFELPSHPNVTIKTEHQSVDECAQAIIDYLLSNKLIYKS
jgi:adenylylsulfate kinase